MQRHRLLYLVCLFCASRRVRSGYERPMYVMLMNWRAKMSMKSENCSKIHFKILFPCLWVSADFLLHRQLCCTVVICPRQNSRIGWDLNWSCPILLASERFLWLSSSIKGFTGMKLWRGGSIWQDYTKISIYPQSLNEERPALMSLLSVTVLHGKKPNRTMEWANDNHYTT